jgi:pyrimidine deaminase RibD-like protein
MEEHLESYMRLAIEQGKKSKAEDKLPHPKVGALLTRDGQLLGNAYRGELKDGEHAEFTLLERKLPNVHLEGSTLFTTLEPCTSRKHPKVPCAQWIINRGISNLYIGMLDPNPCVYSIGVSQLRQHGINVRYFPPPLREEIRADNCDFIASFRANPAPGGKACFNYIHSNGNFTIGHGDHAFNTRWTPGSNVSIHIITYGTGLKGIRHALDATHFSEITDASVYDMSSASILVREGQFVILENANGYFAAIHVLDVKDRNRPPDTYDELTFEYRILTDKGLDFSNQPPVDDSSYDP